METKFNAMLRIERETLDELRAAVKDAAESIANLTGHRTQVLAAVRRVADSLQDEITRIIITARDEAASVAYTRVVIEARLIGIAEPEEPEEDPEDETRAAAAAASFAAAFMMAALLAAGRRDIKKSIGLLDYRLRRIATTEVAQAYGDTMDRAYESIEDEVYKRWDATLDSRVCSYCRGLHGTIVRVHEDFPDGAVPGDVHVNCRCVSELIRNGN